MSGSGDSSRSASSSRASGESWGDRSSLTPRARLFLSTLQEVAEAASGARDPERLAVFEEEAGLLRFVAGRGPVSNAGITASPGEGAIGIAFMTGEPVIVEDYQHWPHSVSWAIEKRMKNALVVPLLTRGRSVGALAVHSEHDRTYDDSDVRVLRLLAAQVAPALESSRLIGELTRVNSQLEESAAHAYEFLAEMSHELRTPLNTIGGFAQLLEDDRLAEDPDKRHRYVANIRRGSEHLLSVINDLLDLAKIRSGRFELDLTNFDLGSVISEVIDSVEPLAARKQVMLHASPNDAGAVIADRRAIRQVFLNLLSNAIKFTKDGSAVVVQVEGLADRVVASVMDAGPGIAPKDVTRIFRAYEQAGSVESQRAGTGLGLPLTKRLVELHGGRIWVRSTMGEGSEFSVELPRRPVPVP